MQKIRILEKKAGYQFKKKALPERALTHSSYDRDSCYERLEFLGDIVLDAIVGIHLFKAYPDSSESFLTDLKSAYVNSRNLHDTGMKLKLHDFINFNNYELPKLDDFVEAFIGALYLDGGWKNTEKFVKKFILSRKLEPMSNHKNILSMVAKKCFGSIPVYTLVKESGPSHRKVYRFKVKILGKRYAGYGKATCKKDAEMKAADDLLSKLKKHVSSVAGLTGRNNP
jgi:ribonuclease-3